MRYHMRREVIFSNKLLFTKLALKRLLTRMDPNMPLQLGRSHKLFVTNVTLVAGDVASFFLGRGVHVHVLVGHVEVEPAVVCLDNFHVLEVLPG